MRHREAPSSGATRMISRRHFLETSTAAAAGLTLAGCEPTEVSGEALPPSIARLGSWA
ncbi:MAG TPA: twin-arginine translocation signal domain-containing protein, partial [Gemmatimonadetes bacterium]|nr:twin-arginine translocation signal domain-containing protein [Gemmatimonadota bacterium]